MPSIEIKKSKAKISSPLPPSKTLIKYKDLLEGIGHQVISKIIQPTVYHYNVQNSTPYGGTTAQPTQPSPTLKQLTGAVTLLYTLVIIVISFGMFLIYLIWPEEENILKKLMMTALPFMLVFTMAILICYFYINRKWFCFSLQNNQSISSMNSMFYNISSKFNEMESSNNVHVNRSQNTSGSSSENCSNSHLKINNNNVITSTSQTSINIYQDSGIHTGISHRTISSDSTGNAVAHNQKVNNINSHSVMNNNNSFNRAFDQNMYRYENGGQYNPNIVKVPMWQAPDISDMKDKVDYQRMAAEQKQLSSTLEFLKYKD